MITTIVINGVVKIVLTPETEIEKEAIKKVAAGKGEIELAADSNNILSKSVSGSLIISSEKEKRQST